MPNGIYFDDKIYWEISQDVASTSGEKIGSLQETASSNQLPSKDFMGTSELKQYLGSELYKNGDTIYLNTKKDILVLQYIEEKISTTTIENYSGSESADYAIPPHFIFNDMIYQSYQGEEIELPSCFKKVDTIKKDVFSAGENLYGNVPKGSVLYAADFQNRFMILKNKDDKKYYLFENVSYRK